MSPEAVEIFIFGKSFTIKCPPNSVEALKKSAIFLEEKMQAVKESGMINFEKIAIITALNLSYQLLSTEQQNQHQSQTLNQHLCLLLNKIESVLGRQPQLEFQGTD